MVGVRVSYNSPGGEEVLEADHVHVAVPAAVVDNIKFEPGLIADHKQAFDSTVTTKVHRVLLDYAPEHIASSGIRDAGEAIMMVSDKLGNFQVEKACV
jgi:hypothetical protein